MTSLAEKIQTLRELMLFTPYDDANRDFRHLLSEVAKVWGHAQFWEHLYSKYDDALIERMMAQTDLDADIHHILTTQPAPDVAANSYRALRESAVFQAMDALMSPRIEAFYREDSVQQFKALLQPVFDLCIKEIEGLLQETTRFQTLSQTAQALLARASKNLDFAAYGEALYATIMAGDENHDAAVKEAKNAALAPHLEAFRAELRKIAGKPMDEAMQTAINAITDLDSLEAFIAFSNAQQEQATARINTERLGQYLTLADILVSMHLFHGNPLPVLPDFSESAIRTVMMSHQVAAPDAAIHRLALLATGASREIELAQFRQEWSSYPPVVTAALSAGFEQSQAHLTTLAS